MLAPRVKDSRRKYFAAHGMMMDAAEVPLEAAKILREIVDDAGGCLSEPSAMASAAPYLLPDLLAATCAASVQDDHNERAGGGDDVGNGSWVVRRKPLRVLDVGSCYGPFQQKILAARPLLPPPQCLGHQRRVELDVIPVPLSVLSIDLQPAAGENTVRKCDWLRVGFTSATTYSANQEEHGLSESGSSTYVQVSQLQSL
jgi:hypothetical protein